MGNSAVKSHIDNAEKTGTFTLQNAGLKEIPEELTSLCENLRTLDLSNNKIEVLPDYIGSFKSLKILKLDKNKLKSVPSAIGKLSRLETLSLQDNSIQSLPPTVIDLKNLKTVNLSGNQLQTFPLEMATLKKLDVLDLSRNKIFEIPDGVEDLQVTELSLSQNQIRKISSSLSKCQRLRTLRLEENCLTIEAIPVELLKSSNVSLILLEGNVFEMKTFAEVDGYSEVQGLMDTYRDLREFCTKNQSVSVSVFVGQCEPRVTVDQLKLILKRKGLGLGIHENGREVKNFVFFLKRNCVSPDSLKGLLDELKKRHLRIYSPVARGCD